MSATGAGMLLVASASLPSRMQRTKASMCFSTNLTQACLGFLCKDLRSGEGSRMYYRAAPDVIDHQRARCSMA